MIFPAVDSINSREDNTDTDLLMTESAGYEHVLLNVEPRSVEKCVTVAETLERQKSFVSARQRLGVIVCLYTRSIGRTSPDSP